MWHKLIAFLFPQPRRRVFVRPPSHQPRGGRPVGYRRPGQPKPVAPVRHHGRIVVGADTRPLWVVRGWRREGNALHGAFRTPEGSVAGLIEIDHLGRPANLYVINPPPRLMSGSHGSCFKIRPPMSRRGFKHFWVHFSTPPPEVDAAIVAVEDLCRQALSD